MYMYYFFRAQPNVAKPRHTKSVKIGLSLFLVFIFSYTPTIYAIVSRRPISGYFRYTNYINNLANFFIYLLVDEEFRAKLGAIFKCKR